MRTLKFKIPHIHISLERLPQLAALGLGTLALLVLAGVGWFGWKSIVQPYQQKTVSQDKLTKGLDTLNVKDFTTVRDAAVAKTKVDAGKADSNPFGP